MFATVITWLVDPAGLTPHGFCLSWQPGLLWLHAVSDFGIGMAYFSIPFALGIIIRRRPDLIFRPFFVLSGAFILLCGAGHWLDVVTLWVPAYGLEGVVKAMTAVVSILAAGALWKLLPTALTFPSPAQLRDVRHDLHDVQQAELRMGELARNASEARDELARELTRREGTEAALRESQERVNLLLHSNLVEALYLLDPSGIIESWNASAERLKGYNAGEVIGQNYAMFFTPEEITQDVPARMLKSARGSGHIDAEDVRVRKGGGRFLARMALDVVRNDDGTLRGFVVVTRDVTQERIEEQQREIIIKAAPNGLMIVDESGLITLANVAAERIFGYPEGTLAGQPVEALVPEYLRDSHTALRSAFTSGRSDTPMSPQRQFAGCKRDGGMVTIEIMLSPVKTPRGSIVIAALFDVTERLRLAAEQEAVEQAERHAVAATNARLERLAGELAEARDHAEQASRAKSRFLAGMSHELRTPLNGILGYAHLLQMEGGLSPTQRGRVDAMLGAGRHLLELIACVLDLSEIEADHVVLHPADLSIKAIATACIDLIRPTAEAKGIALSVDIGFGTPAKLVADPARLRQVLLNLLGNAAKFTASGMIELRVRPAAAGNILRIEVVDSGPGVAIGHRGRLFREFERLDTEATRTIEGAGLGLALSARLAILMGGRLGYEDNPSGGSVFWVELPLDVIAPRPADVALPGVASVAKSPETVAPTSRNVLVVDDVLMNRDIAGSFLRAAGHTVTCVESGQDAVDAVTSTDFDVVLMDVRMPGMDGLEATRIIRALQGPRGQVPIVALTAQSFIEQIAACQAAGMDGHASKPFDPETLLAAMLAGIAAGKQRVECAAVPVVTPSTAPQPAIFDPATFRRTTAFLTPEAVAGHLETIAGNCDNLLRRLRAPHPLAERQELADLAHALSGSAGMFGFGRLASSGRGFEGAVQAGSPDLAASAEALAGAIEASLDAIHAGDVRGS